MSIIRSAPCSRHPEIVFLAVAAAEKRAEGQELDAFQRRFGAARPDGGGIVGGYAVDLDRVELVQPFALQQWQRRDRE